MELIDDREFARRKGVSITTVRNGLKAGRIAAAKDGRIDWDSQAQAWDSNQKHPQKRPNNLNGGRPRKGEQPKDKKPAGEQEAGKGEMTLAAIQRARELVKLQLDNVKLREAQGELVKAADVEKQGRALAAAVIAGLYNIPERISDELAGMTDAYAIQQLLLREIDGAVEQLRKSLDAD